MGKQIERIKTEIEELIKQLEMDDKERARAYESGVKALFAGLIAWAEKGGETNG